MKPIFKTSRRTLQLLLCFGAIGVPTTVFFIGCGGGSSNSIVTTNSYLSDPINLGNGQ